MFEGLLHLKGALQSMPSTSGCPVLTELEWWVLEVGEEVLRPLMLAMMTLEGQNYVTGSLVIPMVESIRKGLHAAHDRLVELGEAIGAQAFEKGQDFHMQDILQAMIDDFDSRWGDGEDINKYTLGTIGTNKGQPCGYTKGQVLCLTLDPRMVTLPQVAEDQEEDVWRVLEVRCQELMRDDETERRRSVHAKPSLPHGDDKSHNCQTTNLLGCKKPSKMVPPADIPPDENVVDVVKLAKEVSLTNTYFLRPLCIRIIDTHYCDLVSFLIFFIQEVHKYIRHATYTHAVKLEDNPLAWWKQHGHLFPTLSRLARRYLATPATSCPVERLFSVAGQVDASRRANLSSDNLTLLVFMHEALPLLRKIRALKILQESLSVL